MSEQEAWEDVLGRVEADVRRAALLLVPDGTALAAGAARSQPSRLDEPQPLTLPDPAQLPPVPAEMRERLVGLYDEIERVSSGIRAALAQGAAAQRLSAALPPVPPGSRFLDRRA